VHQNAYLLCDFEDAVEVKAEEKVVVDLTTVEYSSPEFLRYIRHPKEKCFDPFKLDVYSFGLTLLFLCSMGRFSLEERTNFIYESSEKSHADFIKDQRVKWIRNQGEYKTFNSLIKLMLEEDEYKRDDFITLLIKTQFKEEDENSEYNLSDDNSNSKSSANLKKKQKKAAKERKLAEIKYRELKVYGGLSAGMIVIFILFCLL
jgi:serine/threonine protein kinase